MKMFKGFILLLMLASCATQVVPVKEYVPVVKEQVPMEEIKPVEVFHTELTSKWVVDLVSKANCTINTKSFRTLVESKESFDYSDKSGKGVYASLLSGKCGIRTYKTANPFSSVIATTYTSDREYLYLNLRKNPRSIGPMVNTAVHECIHLQGFSHGNNSPVGKDNSVNYLVGDLAEEASAECIQE